MRNEILRQMKAEGFVAIRQLMDGESLRNLLSHVDHFISEIVPGLPPRHVFYEDKSDPTSLKQIQQMESHDAWFHQLLTTGRFREIAELVLQGPVVPKNLQYFNKPPGVGRPTPPHQDGFYFMLNPCEAVTMWFALDDADQENGCVRYVTGSHQLGIRQHARTKTLGFSQGIVDYPSTADLENEVLVTAAPGDLLIHDAMTIHRADGNQSTQRTRRALGLIYYSHRAVEDTAAHSSYQRKLATEMREAERQA